jgi:hypothetical protein
MSAQDGEPFGGIGESGKLGWMGSAERLICSRSARASSVLIGSGGWCNTCISCAT